MDRAISLEARRIDLALEPPFTMGAVTIDPPAHEIRWDGACRRVQPQTLKVLVALHDKIGQVVTRDELVDRCWDGRFVGADVINRCILLLRRVGEESSGIEIQTVPKEGYRLAGPNAISGETGRLALLHGARRVWLAVIGVIFLTGLIGGLIAVRARGPAPGTVMLEPFDVAGTAPLARTLAAGVSADVGAALSAAGVDVVQPPPASRLGEAEFVLSGRAELLGPDLHLTVELEDFKDNSILWSTRFTRPASEMQAMQEQVAANIAAVLRCALETSQQPRDNSPDPETAGLYLQACDLLQTAGAPSEQASRLLAQVTARRPQFAAAWARLAYALAQTSLVAAPQDTQRFGRRSRIAAATALRLDPHSELAYEALTDMKLRRTPAPFAEIYRDFQKALAADPDSADFLNDEGELLLRMGRERDALGEFRRGAELDPLSPVQTTDLIRGLIDNLQNSEAKMVLQRALRIWPDDPMLRLIHYDYEARFDDPATALMVLNDPGQRPPRLSEVALQGYLRLAEARRSNDFNPFIVWVKRQVAADRLSADFAAPQLALHDSPDAAFAMAFAAPVQLHRRGPETDPEFLWQPEAANLRRDRRFIALARKFNVGDFWLSTALWPDFCSNPGWPYDCRAESGALRGLSRPSARSSFTSS